MDSLFIFLVAAEDWATITFKVLHVIKENLEIHGNIFF